VSSWGSHTETRQARRLGVVLVITTVFTVLELVGATAARSQVLWADGVHLLTDVLALALSIAAMRLAVRPATERFTFGLRRVEPLAAVLNGFLVLGASVVIAYEAATDLRGTVSPRPTLMLIVAAAAFVIHGLSAWLLHDVIHHDGHDHGHSHDHSHEDAHAHHDEPHAGHEHSPPKHRGHALNLRGVWLHLLGDTLGAFAALGAALVIHGGGPAIVDPLGSLVVAVILVVGALRLLGEASMVLLEATPPHLPARVVREVIQRETGVLDVLDLRVWTLGAGHDAVAVQVRAAAPCDGLASRIGARLRHDLHVEQVTVQVSEDG
jgi:cobalt-zinc-cadmium efflux system protein